MAEITRETILQALKVRLEALPYTHAMWEGGAAAWGRVDEWSDIDLQIDADDDHLADAYKEIEAGLEALAPIDLSFRVPYPDTHPYWQTFYRLKGTSPFLLIDLAVFRHSAVDKMLEVEKHGKQVVWFDKDGTVAEPHIDRDQHRQMLVKRRESLKSEFAIFQVMVLKEINRNHPVEAVQYYYRHTLQPLLQALGMKYRPERYNYHTRYVYDELPEEVVQKLEKLYFVNNLMDLEMRQKEAEEWFWEVMDSL